MTGDRRTDDVAAGVMMCVGLIRRRLRQIPVAGALTFPETAALSRLDRHGPQTSADLARAEQITPQTMGATVADLEARGLIRRQRDPADGRRVLLSLSAGGRRELNRRRSARAAQLATGLREFEEADIDLLARAIPLLERLAESLQ